MVTDEVTDDTMGRDGAGAGIRADGPPAHAAADTTTAQSTQTLRNGIIL